MGGLSRATRSFRHKYFWRLSSYFKLVSQRDSFLHTSGWIESFRRGYPCRPDGNAVPWMNYSTIALLEDRLRPELTLFEFGSGYSTRFLAERVQSITAVEHNADWFARQQAEMPANVTLLHRPAQEDSEYCRAVGQGGQPFHVIIVDGVDRVNCMRESLSQLTPDGVILLDDTQRPAYQPAFERANSAGFRTLRLVGMKPNSPTLQQSHLFYRDGNCLGI